jgi:DNA-binding NtrC family response regulator
MPKFSGKRTLLTHREEKTDTLAYYKCKLVVVEGPEENREFVMDRDVVRVGSSGDNDLVINDETVSRNHFEIRVAEEGYLIRDLSSTNGTDVEGCRIKEAYLHPGARIGAGEVVLVFQPLRELVEVPLSTDNSFGKVLGKSIKMRALFHLADRVASRDTTVLISGETGTGKGLLAEEVHLHSPRGEKPFVVVDCSTIPAHLMEDELFGHVKGAFTGATFQVDVRIIAATNRDLKAEVEAGNFREDLYFRLGVFELKIPPLREHKEDIAFLAREFVKRISGDKEKKLGENAIRFLSSHDWPGNVRELGNVIERVVHLVDDKIIDAPSIMSTSITGVGPPPDSKKWGGRGNLPFSRAREIAEKEYLVDLLRRHDFNVSQASRTAEIHRQSLHRLLRKHGIKVSELEGEN